MKKIVAVTTFSLTLILACLSVAAQQQTPSRDDVVKQIETKRAEIAALEPQLLSISDADKQEFAEFTAQPQTGLIRLLPREKYTKLLTLSGGGGYYSFARSTHEYGYGSDIALESGMLSVGFAGADYGMLFNLGDLPLDQATAEHRAVRALLDYTPPTKETDVRKMQQQVWQGIELSGMNFKNRSSARVGNTYVVRSISFERSDLLVAFRLLREDTDGSFILAFKVLKKFSTPDLERTRTAANN